MLEATVIAVRLAQYLGATVLFGSSLFFVYATPRAAPPWGRRLAAGAAAVLALSSMLGIVAQSSLFAGSFAGGLAPEALGAVVSYMALGKAALVRAFAATAALVLVLALASRRSTWGLTAVLAAIATVSMVWMGHAAATEGSLRLLHLASDALHLVAATVWVGALVCFLLWLLTARTSDERLALHGALRRFSGIGSILVAVLIATGLVNGWVVIGPDRAAALLTTPYGLLLAIKLALFVVMLGLAALNRYRLTPALGLAGDDAAIGSLRRSLSLETAGGFAVMVLVAWLGTLSPTGSA